ncbi:MAG: NADH-quinone oxidoreductase subunit C [Bacteroidetes bacterium]|nr:NADH-quinone oxidoreductase subunit C [Bacteroidota bacterium]
MSSQDNNQIELVEKLKSLFETEILKHELFRDALTVIVKRDRILDLMKHLKEVQGYDMLVSLTAVDYLKMEKSPRFAVVYHLRAMKTGQRVRIKVPISENDSKIESLTSLWKVANWLEREAWEMYGIEFLNHPDMRRLLTPDTFTNYPLRKDYPLRGKGEREVILPEGT